MRAGFMATGKEAFRGISLLKAIDFFKKCKKFVDTISSFSVIFLSVTIEKQVKCKMLQWQPKDAQRKLLEDQLRREKLRREGLQQKEQLVRKLKKDLPQSAEDKIKKIIACHQAIILIF